MEADRFAAFLEEQMDRAARDERNARDDCLQAPMDDPETDIAYARAQERYATLQLIARRYHTLERI